MSTARTLLATSGEEGLAFVTSSPDSLARLLMHQILAARLARSGENNLLLLEGVVIVGDDGRIFLVGFDNGSPPLTTGNQLSLGALGRVTGALGASDMLAVGAFLGRSEVGVTSVAGTSYAHTNGLVHAENSIIGRSSVPIRRLKLETIALSKLLSSLLKHLIFSEFGDALLIFVLGLLGHLERSGGLAAVVLVFELK